MHVNSRKVGIVTRSTRNILTGLALGIATGLFLAARAVVLSISLLPNLIHSPVGTVRFDSICRRRLGVHLRFYMLSDEFKTRSSTVLVYEAVLFHGYKKVKLTRRIEQQLFTNGKEVCHS